MTSQPITNVLFVCTGNSARSILAETILNRLGEGRFQAFSAGSKPTGVVNPYAVAMLKVLGYDDVAGARSKSWDEFMAPDAPEIDLVITLCDQAAGETCPVWPGNPQQLHWGFPDPAAQTNEGATKVAFMDVYEQIMAFVTALMEVPISGVSGPALHDSIGANLKASAS
jgi:arsenate reductase